MNQVCLDELDSTVQKVKMVFQACQDSQDLKETEVSMECLVYQVNQGYLGLMALKAMMGGRDSQVLQERKENVAGLDSPVLQDPRETQEIMAFQDFLVTQDLKVYKVQKASKVHQVCVAGSISHLDQKVLPDQREIQDSRDCRE